MQSPIETPLVTVTGGFVEFAVVVLAQFALLYWLLFSCTKRRWMYRRFWLWMVVALSSGAAFMQVMAIYLATCTENPPWWMWWVVWLTDSCWIG